MRNQTDNKNELQEKMVDTILKHAAEKAFEDMVNEAAESTEAVTFSERHEAAMEQLFAEYKKGAPRTPKEEKKGKVLRAKFLIPLVAILIIGCAIGAVATKPKVFSRKTDTTETNTRIEYVEGETAQNTYATDEVKLEYIPEGLELTGSRQDGDNIWLQFKKGEREFSLSLASRAADAAVQEEGATLIRIQGTDAFLLEKDGAITIWWEGAEYAYTLSGNLGRQEMIKIAENVK